MGDLTTEHSFDLQATWAIGVLGLLFDMLSMGVCTTRQWQTSGRLVQELIVKTVRTLNLDRVGIRSAQARHCP